MLWQMVIRTELLTIIYSGFSSDTSNSRVWRLDWCSLSSLLSGVIALVLSTALFPSLSLLLSFSFVVLVEYIAKNMPYTFCLTLSLLQFSSDCLRSLYVLFLYVLYHCECVLCSVPPIQCFDIFRICCFVLCWIIQRPDHQVQEQRASMMLL